MGSQTLPKLPVIDLSNENLKPGSTHWFSASNDVRRALEEYGCFIAVYDEVPIELCNTTFAVLEELFDLPTEIKIKHTYTTKPFHGYDGQYPFIPLYESLGIDDATNLEKIQSFTNLMWPAGNDRFCETAHSYAKQVPELDKMVTRMIFESYGIEKYYEPHAASSYYLLRLLKYGVPQIYETHLGLHSHTDKTFISILHQNQVNGLEIIKKKKDGEWISYEPFPSSFVVLAGEAIMAWGNDRIHNPMHRVLMSGNEERYSVGLFAFSNGMVQTPKELVDEEHPLMFKPFDHIGLLSFIYTDEGVKAECLIKAYCGV